MQPDKTEFEWSYQPPDFFEAVYVTAHSEYRVSVEHGRVVVEVGSPRDPVDPILDCQIRAHVESIFAVREMQTHRSFELSGPTLRQDHGDHQNAITRISGSFHLISEAVPSMDLIHRDSCGNVVRDTRAERIAADTALLDTLAPKLCRSLELGALVDSYSKAVADPGNELVHLYEVRDGLATHFGSKTAACTALNISKHDWDRLGVLANVDPLREGRHRGKHPQDARAATQGELAEARMLVRRWIEAFAATI